jgi:hypothetical protein
MITLALRKVILPITLVAIVAGLLVAMLQPLAKPAINAAQQAIESLQVAYASASASSGKFAQGGWTIHNGPSFGWRIDDKSCRIYGYFSLPGREFRPDKVIDKAHCSASNVGSAFDKFFDGIKRYLMDNKSTIDPKVWAQARIGLNELLKNASEAGLKISVTAIP